MVANRGERLPQQPQITTITGGFSLAGATEEERSCDERIHSERLATTFDTEHYEIVIQPSGLARALPSVVWHLEDLRVSSSYHNYYVARLASRFVKVVLAGAGGDELFGGYPWRYAVLDGASEAEFEERYFQYWSRLLSPEERSGFFTEHFRRSAGDFDPRDPFLAITRDYDAPALVDRALTFEARVYLHGLFVLEDKLSMAHGLESRVPFLDDDLVELRATHSGPLQGQQRHRQARAARRHARSYPGCHPRPPQARVRPPRGNVVSHQHPAVYPRDHPE